jgi:hypothetical protein
MPFLHTFPGAAIEFYGFSGMQLTPLEGQKDGGMAMAEEEKVISQTVQRIADQEKYAIGIS